MKCQKCSHTVTRKSKFCQNCGERIVPRKSSRAAAKEKKLPVGYAVALVGLGLLLGYLFFQDDTQSRNSVTPPAAGFQEAISIQSPAVLEIASEFMCPCGTCEHRLDACDCEHDNGALELKGFIVQKLRESHHKPHIIEMILGAYPVLNAHRLTAKIPVPELN